MSPRGRTMRSLQRGQLTLLVDARCLHHTRAGIAKFTPQDATTNPSLVKAAAMMDKYKHVVDEAVAYGKVGVRVQQGSIFLCWS